MTTAYRHWHRRPKRLRPRKIAALSLALSIHAALVLLWLDQSPAPGRQYNGTERRLNLRLYPVAESAPAPREPARTTASTGQSTQTRPGGTRSTAAAIAVPRSAPTAAAQIASPRLELVPEDPLSQSRWRESGSPWQEELEKAAREQIAEETAAARSPWPYDQPLPALPFDDYGEKPLVMLPPENARPKQASVKFLGMSIGISAVPVMDSPNEVGRWASDNPMNRAMEQMQRSECQPAPGDGPDWRRPGWCQR